MHVSGERVSLQNITMPIFIQVAAGESPGVTRGAACRCTMPWEAADKAMRIYPIGHVGMIASSLSQRTVLPELGRWLRERS